LNRKYLVAIGLSSTLLIGSSVVALADPSLEEINAFLNNTIKIELNGQEVQLQDEQGRQLIPITYEGRTYLPIRSIGSALDMTVTWDSVNNRVTLQKGILIGKWSDVNKGTVMELTIDGKLLRAGVEVGEYNVLDGKSVRIISKGKETTIYYELSGNTLKWGPQLDQTFQKMSNPPSISAQDNNPISVALNGTYKIENDSIRLTNGKNEKDIAPDSATKIITRVWGEPAVGDLNADGSNDVALVLAQNPGGSGTFYYVAASIRDRESQHFISTNSILLGDRIALQNISIEKGTIIVNYADRKKGESMSTRPSVGFSKYLHIDGNTLKEVKEEL